MDIAAEQGDAAIARSIVDLGRHLGLDVVAEGVEDEETWQMLTEMGCTLAQGWHLARPMPTCRPAGLARVPPAAGPAAPGGVTRSAAGPRRAHAASRLIG